MICVSYIYRVTAIYAEIILGVWENWIIPACTRLKGTCRGGRAQPVG
jgi:hypothetical protein